MVSDHGTLAFPWTGLLTRLSNNASAWPVVACGVSRSWIRMHGCVSHDADASTVVLGTQWRGLGAVVAVDTQSGKLQRVSPDGSTASWSVLSTGQGSLGNLAAVLLVFI